MHLHVERGLTNWKEMPIFDRPKRSRLHSNFAILFVPPTAFISPSFPAMVAGRSEVFCPTARQYSEFLY